MRHCTLFIILSLSIVKFSIGQNFYQDYRAYYLEKINKRSNANYNVRRLYTAIKHLKEDFGEFKRKTGHSFFSRDTLYIVSFPAAENHTTVTWNGSWSFLVTYETYKIGGHTFSKNGTLKIGAAGILKQLPKKLIRAVENGDEAYFTEHAKEFNVLNSSVISFVRAIRTKNKWVFASGLSYDIDM